MLECGVKKWFYERNDYVLNHEVNKTFEEILMMTPTEFREWVIALRCAVVYAWDELGIPPRVGYNEYDIIDQFNKMRGYPIHEFLQTDELTNTEDIIRNTSNIGNAVNQFFPTMMKTRINYTKDVNKGRSIYDFFSDDTLLDTFVTYASRHFKRDSFYNYSRPIRIGEMIDTIGSVSHIPSTVHEFIEWFESKARVYQTHDYWFEPCEEESNYTGYDEKLKAHRHPIIKKQELIALNPPAHTITHIDHKNAKFFRIRWYEKGQKLFPIGFKAFRVSFCQYAVNFPPLTAKFLYERYTKHCASQNRIVLYDPSAGWGGRILGAMSVNDSRNIHYVGTDPNTDHITSPGRTKYHEVADFFNNCQHAQVFPHSHSYEIFQLGSEEIHRDPRFQSYKGKVDLVFTSPPYFAKEAYSDDPEQSYKKFSQYDLWRDGFLKKTLETCVEWLRSDRYLLWNIADAQFGGEMLPLEEDSKIILESLGMIYKGKLKMTLAQTPGGNRVDHETGKPKAKNFCKSNGLWLKYEPIFVFYKP